MIAALAKTEAQALADELASRWICSRWIRGDSVDDAMNPIGPEQPEPPSTQPPAQTSQTSQPLQPTTLTNQMPSAKPKHSKSAAPPQSKASALTVSCAATL